MVEVFKVSDGPLSLIPISSSYLWEPASFVLLCSSCSRAKMSEQLALSYSSAYSLVASMVIGKVPWCLSFLHGRRSPAAASKVSVHKGALQHQETEQPRHSCSPFDCLPGKKEAHLCQFWSCETQRQFASIGPGSADASCPGGDVT